MKLVWLGGVGAAAISAAASVHAVRYLTLEQANKTLFPAASEFRARSLLLTAAQSELIARQAGVRVREAQVRAWEARDAQGALLGHVLVDEVTGKHEFITYAVAVSVQGKVIGIEIMDYRESYGGQIRDERWRAQFHGKAAADAVRIDQDIKNISGATLSCVHVTDGVRRLLATYEAVIKTAI